MKLIVLLSTYNGEKYLKAQLDSLLQQDLRPDKILVRDDGSKDDTVAILEDYCSKYSFIRYFCGPNKGPAKSFWELICNCEEADYYALCDQDDVWFKDKLFVAVERLEKEDNQKPLLYCSRYTLTDAQLNPINTDISSLYGYSDFPHSLVYHTAPGCTFVFNHEARKQIIKYDLDQEYCLIHDAIIHKIVCMFGKMILDSDSHMYYRQHGDNEIGMDANALRVFIGRINRFLNGKIRNYRSNTAKSLLKVYGQECSKEDKRLLEMLAGYRDSKELKKQLLKEKSFRTNTINDLFFKILVFVNYI